MASSLVQPCAGAYQQATPLQRLLRWAAAALLAAGGAAAALPQPLARCDAADGPSPSAGPPPALPPFEAGDMSVRAVRPSSGSGILCRIS